MDLSALELSEFRSLIKVLSDNSVPATLVLVGVADSVDALIVEHQSIERALVQNCDAGCRNPNCARLSRRA
jgi:hypothetical protein